MMRERELENISAFYLIHCCFLMYGGDLNFWIRFKIEKVGGGGTNPRVYSI